MSEINQSVRDMNSTLYLPLSPSIDLPDETIQLFDLSVNPWRLPEDSATVEFDVKLTETGTLPTTGRAS